MASPKKKPPTKLSIADIPGAVAAPLPQIITPQLATLAAGLPSRGEWLYEIKFDGYRILTRFQDGKPALITRRGNDWSSKMPQLTKELKTIGIQSGWLDGEIVVFNQRRRAGFQRAAELDGSKHQYRHRLLSLRRAAL